MATWRRINNRFAVSDDGKSLRLIDWYARYDTPKGWVDMPIHAMPDFSEMIDLPGADLCRWKRPGGEEGLLITEDDIQAAMIDIADAFVVLGNTCSFNEVRYVY